MNSTPHHRKRSNFELVENEFEVSFGTDAAKNQGMD